MFVDEDVIRNGKNASNDERSKEKETMREGLMLIHGLKRACLHHMCALAQYGRLGRPAKQSSTLKRRAE
jgi:hypothetical protein